MTVKVVVTLAAMAWTFFAACRVADALERDGHPTTVRLALGLAVVGGMGGVLRNVINGFLP